MARLPLAAGALAAWNLFVWGGRFRNLINEPGPLADVNRWSLVGSVVFSLLAIATVITLIGARRVTRYPASALAVLGIVVWAYRAVVILGRSYSPGFVVVHSVLALVSIGLGLWYLRSIRRGGFE